MRGISRVPSFTLLHFKTLLRGRVCVPQVSTDPTGASFPWRPIPFSQVLREGTFIDKDLNDVPSSRVLGAWSLKTAHFNAAQ